MRWGLLIRSVLRRSEVWWSVERWGVEREVWEERGAKRGVKRSVEREGVRWWGREGGRGVRIFNCLSLLRVFFF